MKVYLAGYIKVVGFEGNIHAELTQLHERQDMHFSFTYDLSRQYFDNARTIEWKLKAENAFVLEHLGRFTKVNCICNNK